MVACSQAVALVSAGPGDTIAQLSVPPDSVLVNATGTLVATDFATFVAEGPADGLDLGGAGVLRGNGTVAPMQFATGSTAAGGLGPNCSNWTMPSGEATIGFSNVPGTAWLDGGANGPFTVSCEPNSSLPVLCACWME